MSGDRPAGRDPEETAAQPPLGGAHQVGMPDVLDREAGAAVGEDRVRRAALERARGAWAARDRDRVSALGSAFSEEEIPVAVYLVEVRPSGRSRPLPCQTG